MAKQQVAWGTVQEQNKSARTKQECKNKTRVQEHNNGV